MPDANGEKKDSDDKTSGSETGNNTAEGAAGDKKEKTKPKYEWIEVKKPKTRTKRTPLEVSSNNTPGLN